ncbi:hypothetical protein V6N13_039716 [Hibiscus sabdariffa]
MGSSCYICIVIWCWFQLTQYYDYPHLLFWVFPPLLYGKRVKDLFGILAAKFWKPKKRTWIGVVNAHRAYYLTMEHRMIVFRDSKAENVVPQRQPPLLHLMELCEKDSNSEFPFPPYPESQVSLPIWFPQFSLLVVYSKI